MRKLYEIDEAIENCIINGTDPETGEFLAGDALEALQMEREAKIEGVALFAKDCRAEAAAIKAEMENLKSRYDRLNRNADGAEQWVAYVLGGHKFSTAKVDCAWRKSQVVEVDEDFVAWADKYALEDYLTIKHTVNANKTAIKKALKDGVDLPHCRLVERNNLTIK